MDFYHSHKENRAMRQEARHERKEARLHGRAVNAAMHGNVFKAARLEVRASNSHHRAEEAHLRATAHNNCIQNPGYLYGANCRPRCGNRATVVHHYASPVPAATYPTGNIPPPPTYPIGTVPPPPQQQPVVYPQAAYPNPPAQAPAYPYPADPPPPYSGYPTDVQYPYPTK